MDTKKSEIEKLISPILENHRIYLVDMELRGNPNSQVLSVYVDTEQGITLQQISEVTREIEGILDLEDPLPGKYRLDVSSPGIDRPLTEKWQFRKNIGKELQLTLEENGKTIQKNGILEEVREDCLILSTKKQSFSVGLDEIKKAMIKLKW